MDSIELGRPTLAQRSDRRTGRGGRSRSVRPAAARAARRRSSLPVLRIIEAADALYGITMHGHGDSTMISQQIATGQPG